MSDYDKVGEVALQLFLAMSLMSMDLSSLAGAFSTIFVVLCVQILVISLFAMFVIFRVMGKDYDAAVLVGGFCGLGMGATPVAIAIAIANMNAITAKHGSSFKAFYNYKNFASKIEKSSSSCSAPPSSLTCPNS